MSGYPWQRAIIMIGLGAGVFCSLVGLLALLAWFTTGSWRSLLQEISLVAALATVPVAYHLWANYVFRRL